MLKRKGYCYLIKTSNSREYGNGEFYFVGNSKEVSKAIMELAIAGDFIKCEKVGKGYIEEEEESMKPPELDFSKTIPVKRVR